MNEDRLAGAAENLGGRATAATGRIIGDDAMIARGEAHQVSGKMRNIAGSIRDFLGIESADPAPSAPIGDRSPPTYSGKDKSMNEDEINGGVRYVKGKIEKGVGDVTTDTKWQADGVIDQVAGGAQNLYGRAKDKVHDVIGDAPDAIAGAGEKVRDVASRGRTIANDQVKDNPWILVAAAGIAGYALSLMVHGRRD